MTTAPIPDVTPANWGQQVLDWIEEQVESVETQVSDAVADLTGDLQVCVATATDNMNAAVALGVGAFAAWTTGLLVVVPPTDRYVQLSWCVPVLVTTGGVGSIATRVVETTSGSAVDKGAANIASSGTGLTNGTFDAQHTILGDSPPLAPTNAYREFRLEAGVFRSSGSLAASVQASSPSGLVRNPFLKAVLL